METYTEGILQAGKIIMSAKVDPIMMAVKFKSTRSLMAANYFECLRNGLESIESLPEDERLKLWNRAKEIGEGLTKKQLIDLCRCIHWYDKMK